jgi:hypothetical protein
MTPAEKEKKLVDHLDKDPAVQELLTLFRASLS